MPIPQNQLSVANSYKNWCLTKLDKISHNKWNLNQFISHYSEKGRSTLEKQTMFALKECQNHQMGLEGVVLKLWHNNIQR